MPFVPWPQLTLEQQVDATMLRLDWPPNDFYKYEFYVTKAGKASKKKGSQRPTKEELEKMHKKAAEILREARTGHMPRIKGDLQDWKPGHSFSFIRD